MDKISLLKIFYGKEVTLYSRISISEQHSCLHMSRFYDIPINVECVKELIKLGILTEDSGNWETGETHYVLDNINKIDLISENSLKELIRVNRDINITRLVGTYEERIKLL